MLYLNSIENAEASPTEKKFAICHEEVSAMQNVPELAPSRELLAQWQSNEIDWKEFNKKFREEMRAEYSNGKESLLKRLAKRSLVNDIALHSPEPSGERTYRAILEEIINIIWKKEGRTERVRNLARESIEESQPQEDITRILEATLLELNLTKDDKTQLLRENDELKRKIDQLKEKISNQKREIQSLQAEIGEKDTENNKLKRKITRLEGEIRTHAKSIGTKDDQIQSLRAETYKKGRENDELKEQMTQFRDVNAQRRIREIAVEAAGNNSEIRQYFRNISIDERLPDTLRLRLMLSLKKALKISVFDKPALGGLISDYTDFGSTDLDKFHESDHYLAHVIRTQRNLIQFGRKTIDEKTMMGRILCCFFAAALLSPKLPEP